MAYNPYLTGEILVPYHASQIFVTLFIIVFFRSIMDFGKKIFPANVNGSNCFFACTSWNNDSTKNNFCLKFLLEPYWELWHSVASRLLRRQIFYSHDKNRGVLGRVEKIKS